MRAIEGEGMRASEREIKEFEDVSQCGEATIRWQYYEFAIVGRCTWYIKLYVRVVIYIEEKLNWRKILRMNEITSGNMRRWMLRTERHYWTRNGEMRQMWSQPGHPFYTIMSHVTINDHVHRHRVTSTSANCYSIYKRGLYARKTASRKPLTHSPHILQRPLILL